jgi:molecular chaperone DnaJ
MTDAALGTTTRVPALGGELDVDVAPGTQGGEVRVLKEQGMPSLNGSRRGDLYVRLDIAMPTQITDEQRRLLEEFDREAGPETYARREDDEDEGFFRRLKSALR